MNWKSTLDLSFLADLITSEAKITNKQAKEAGKKVAKAICNLSEGMSSTKQKEFKTRFEAVKTVRSFDTILNDLYNYADANKIWVKTLL